MYLEFFAGIIFSLLCFVALNAAMEPVSKSEYCGTKCHEMDTAYQSWKLSVHGTNEKGLHSECIDCHLPSKDDYFTHIIAKAYEGARIFTNTILVRNTTWKKFAKKSWTTFRIKDAWVAMLICWPSPAVTWPGKHTRNPWSSLANRIADALSVTKMLATKGRLCVSPDIQYKKYTLS